MQQREQSAIDQAIASTNRKLKLLEYIITGVLLLAGACAIFDYATEYLETYTVWKAVLGVAGLVGIYHLLAHTMQWPVYGVGNLLNAVGRKMLGRTIRAKGLADRFDVEKDAEFTKGRVKRAAPPPDPGRLV